MKRRLVMILLLLVGGAIVNVAVAWGAITFPLLPQLDSEFHSKLDLTDFLALGWKPAARDWDWYAYGTKSQRSVGVDYTFLTEWGFPVSKELGPRIDWSATAVPVEIGWRLQCGWPARAFGETEKWPPPGPKHVRMITGERSLPTSTLWPGFAINTVFYAVGLWGLFAGPFVLRRRWRIRRGLCPKCAYDLRNRPSESSVCPECGAAVGMHR